MRIERTSTAAAIKAYADQSLNLSGSLSNSHTHAPRTSKSRGRDLSQDPTEFSRALERAMGPAAEKNR